MKARLTEGALAQMSGRWNDAERIYRGILDEAPNCGPALHNLANTLAAFGKSPEAEAQFRRAIEQMPTLAESRYGLSQTLKRQGRHREAQAYFTSRHDIPQLKLPRIPYPQPQWAGEPLEGKRLLIFPEQGLGDQIMMARFAPRLQAMGADVTLLCAPELTGLFSSLGVRVVPAAGATSFPKPDYWTTVMDLPGLMELEGDQVVSDPYLVAERADLGPGFHVGVATNGRPTHHNDQARSLRPQDAERLHALPRTIHSLAQREGRDLKQVAELISGLDLVVTVDTAVAHLAGALGKPVWILIPSVLTDWRWGARGSVSTPWYPTARLFWSAPDGSWGAALDEIERQLSRASQST